ncbi:MAG: helix-turn-helix transcriptional regulator [Bacteroidia bacterium]|nr:helix-turn-helix transcriptional regulator [Bacteroidia bacterium]
MAKDNFEYEQVQKAFGERIRKLREAKGMSLLDLGVITGLEKTAISRIENGRTNVTLRTVTKLARGLNTDLLELFKE